MVVSVWSTDHSHMQYKDINCPPRKVKWSDYITVLLFLTSEESGSEEEEGSFPDDVSVSTTACDVVAGCHRLPDAATLDHERRLQRIATTGGG